MEILIGIGVFIVIVVCLIWNANVCMDDTPRHPNGCVDSGELRNRQHDRDKIRRQKDNQ